MRQSTCKARHSQTVSRAWEIHATCASSAIQMRFDSSLKRFIIRRHLRKVFEGSRCVNGIFCLDHARSGQYAETVLISLMVSGHGGPLAMKKNLSSKRSRRAPKAVLRLPGLDHAKTAVLNSLNCPEAQRGYRYAIDEFVDWYCSEPRLAFNKTVVLRYRIHLESRKLAPGTIHPRLGAVRRLAYEASDCGLLSPDLAAGIRRVKGVKKTGSPTWQLVDRRTKPSTVAGT